MNKENSDIINKFLLIGDNFMPEMHLWDPIVKKYSACGPFTRHKKKNRCVYEIWKIKSYSKK